MDLGLSQTLLQELKHRGPDSTSQLYEDETQLFFGFNRLSIQDRSLKASQPFWSKSRNTLMMFNGELFNGHQLLESHLSFIARETTSDTEILVEMIEHHGLDYTLNQVEGMFACVVYDVVSKEITFVRDYFGVKRLYWTHTKNQFCAASEPRPLLKVLASVEPNQEAVFDWLEFGLINHNSSTFFHGINELPAGHALTLFPDGRLDLRDWRLPIETTPFVGTKMDFLEVLDQSLVAIAERALVGNVDMGMLLSGGIDSSLLYFLSQEAGKELRTFTVIWKDQTYSEQRFVEQMTAPTKFTAIDGDSSLNLKNLEESIAFYAQPFGSPFVLSMESLFQRAAADGVKVLLDANGLDELFFGYPKYLRKSNAWDPRVHQDGTKTVLQDIIGSALKYLFHERTIQDAIGRGLNSHDPRSIDLFVSKVPRALRYSDQASMRFGCELRVPFLNVGLLALANSVPRIWLMNDEAGKLPIRTLLQRRTQASDAANAKKRSLQTPIRELFQGPWQKEVIARIKSSRLHDLGWIDLDEFLLANDHYVSNFDRGEANSNFLWQYLALSMWVDAYL